MFGDSMPARKIRSIAVLFLLWGSLTNVFALQSDKEQPIYIEADRVAIDDRKGVSEYSGNVRLSQGSMVLEADKITVYSPQRKIRRVVAKGDPVRYQQRLDRNDAEIRGQAKIIEYDARHAVLRLKENAQLSRNRSVFSGSYIEYNSIKDIVQASTRVGADQRVRVILQPEKDERPVKEASPESGTNKNQ